MDGRERRWDVFVETMCEILDRWCGIGAGGVERQDRRVFKESEHRCTPLLGGWLRCALADSLQTYNTVLLVRTELTLPGALFFFGHIFSARTTHSKKKWIYYHKR